MSLRAGPLVQEQPLPCHVPLPEQHPAPSSAAVLPSRPRSCSAEPGHAGQSLRAGAEDGRRVHAGRPSSSLLLMAERLSRLLSVSLPAADCCSGRGAAGLTAAARVPHQHHRVAKHGAASGCSGKAHL
jgi:hypothetical protein